MPKSKAGEAWFVVADSEQARLLRLTPTMHGRLHVEQVDQLANTFLPGEHHRPTRLGQPGTAPAPSREHEEKLAHFARALATWLQKLVSNHALAACPLFAPPRMLGAMRKAAPKTLAAKLREQEGEFAGLSAAQLAEHPKIKALLAG
jgi:protein required for attachment to host cells